MNNFHTYLAKLVNKEELNTQEATQLMLETMEGKLSDEEIAKWLVALNQKQETSSEIIAFANVLRKKCVPFPVPEKTGIVIDTCGTGGDGSNTINISTLSAITLASLGHKVIKHGNRSVSSQCGSADILEHLGYTIKKDIEELTNDFLKTNFVFLYAPYFHPAMKNVANARKQLKVKTIFNVLGPLVNPTLHTKKVHLLGVSSLKHLEITCPVLASRKEQTTMIVHSQEGLDEISPISKTYYALIHNNEVEKGEIYPNKLPISYTKSLSQICTENQQQALQVSKEILGGKHKAGIETIALNVCSCIFLKELASNNTKLNINEFLQENLPSITEYLLSGAVKEFQFAIGTHR